MSNQSKLNSLNNLPNWPEFHGIYEKHNDLVMQELVNQRKPESRARIIYDFTIRQAKERVIQRFIQRVLAASQ
jgi:hypothetical protein